MARRPHAGACCRMGDRKISDGLVNPRRVFVLSGPSGVGKNTIAGQLCGRGLAVRAVTATTRPPEPGEVDGRDYHFIDRDEFRRWIEEGRLVEHTQYLGHYYGTPLFSLNEAAESGLPVILTIDVDGGLQVKDRWPEVTLVFVKPPSRRELQERLRQRQRDSTRSVIRRLQRAEEEYAYAERYDYCVVNDDLDQTVGEVARIISKPCGPSCASR